MYYYNQRKTEKKPTAQLLIGSGRQTQYQLITPKDRVLIHTISICGSFLCHT